MSIREANRGLLRKARAPGVERVIQRTLDEFTGILQRWHDSILDALESISIDLSSEGAIRARIERTLNPYREEWVTVIENAWLDGAEAGRAAAIQRHSLDISWSITDPVTRQALKDHAQEAADQVQQRMVGDISAAISEAYDEGFGPDRIAQVLREDVFPDMTGYEAKRVARTEGVSAGNRGRQSSIQDAGASQKRWMARDDDRTRHSHNEADGQTVDVGEPFTVGGEEAMFPGDPTLPPEERIHCRCLILPEFDT